MTQRQIRMLVVASMLAAEIIAVAVHPPESTMLLAVAGVSIGLMAVALVVMGLRRT